uniref:Uncharacterized protein n=1 Tax=Chromera velia CCMP2878 TaxID=1169474 RepID=A0A0G4I6U9_9ALVE|eukprot:Cvel_11482.t1-p1 / transcript=Cvel_11482.t1 / gene=Cvel_11482 / organism=Chromera_velia_CCMP2878 / gene_product=hypothetical protein / transcript_product=hypothetical protein / location=Cvel_scaffold723:22610-41782(+) / protein_length=656 / sequence_SO=supercontig / SO=protein_coding / is_pseudo=false
MGGPQSLHQPYHARTATFVLAKFSFQAYGGWFIRMVSGRGVGRHLVVRVHERPGSSIPLDHASLHCSTGDGVTVASPVITGALYGDRDGALRGRGSKGRLSFLEKTTVTVSPVSPVGSGGQTLGARGAGACSVRWCSRRNCESISCTRCRTSSLRVVLAFLFCFCGLVDVLSLTLSVRGSGSGGEGEGEGEGKTSDGSSQPVALMRKALPSDTSLGSFSDYSPDAEMSDLSLKEKVKALAADGADHIELLPWRDSDEETDTPSPGSDSGRESPGADESVEALLHSVATFEREVSEARTRRQFLSAFFRARDEDKLDERLLTFRLSERKYEPAPAEKIRDVSFRGSPVPQGSDCASHGLSLGPASTAAPAGGDVTSSWEEFERNIQTGDIYLTGPVGGLGECLKFLQEPFVLEVLGPGGDVWDMIADPLRDLLTCDFWHNDSENPRGSLDRGIVCSKYGNFRKSGGISLQPLWDSVFEANLRMIGSTKASCWITFGINAIQNWYQRKTLTWVTAPWRKKKGTAFFCTEYTAVLLKRMGTIKSGVTTGLMTPGDLGKVHPNSLEANGYVTPLEERKKGDVSPILQDWLRIESVRAKNYDELEAAAIERRKKKKGKGFMQKKKEEYAEENGIQYPPLRNPNAVVIKTFEDFQKNTAAYA